MNFYPRHLFLLVAFGPLAFGQAGDRAGDVQTSRVPASRIPPAPALSAEQALKSFKIQDGFKIQIAASDPLIDTPVSIQFDPDGRIWVLEMRGYMPNEKGDGETAAVGRVSVLTDTNGDGRMDKSTVFVDKLVMPRAFMLVRDGILLSEPPLLWFYRDSNGDGVADQKTLVSDNYAAEANPLLGNRANQEHSANSPVWAMDNWIYSANYATRFRNTAGTWERGATVSRGQWGLSQDDYGRLFHNSNSDQLRGDLVQADYLTRNTNLTGLQGGNYKVAASQEVWPGRVNPSVNRGYQDGQLRDDGTLATFTAACGPVIYRGGLFPAAYEGNAFMAEPAANIVRRNILTEKDGVITANNPYNHTEFLTSTDERFRPVNLFTGPDGALYIVDIYRGLIQHRVYVTTYLLNQTLDRNLQAPTNLGRIYRVVPPSGRLQPSPHMSTATSAELVRNLTNPNGWWRDTAQRLLVERADMSAVPALKKMAVTPSNPLAQIHALWTLDGLGRTDKATIAAALGSRDPKVRSTAIRISETLLQSPAQPEVIASLLRLSSDPDPTVQWQLALTLGQVRDPQSDQVLAAILLQDRENAMVRDAVLSSIGGRELEFAERLVQDGGWRTQNAATAQILTSLGRAVFVEGKPDRLNRFLSLVAGQTGDASWRELAMLDGLTNASANAGRGGRGAGGGAGRGGAAPPANAPVVADDSGAAADAEGVVQPTPAPPAGRGNAAAGAGRGGAAGGRGGRGGAARVTVKKLPAEPPALATLRTQTAPEVARRVTTLETMLTWPGKPGAVAEEPVVPLTPAQEVLFRTGKEIYLTTCGACHQPDGNGRDGLAPPLLDSEWATGSEARVIRIALQGVRGPITVKGKAYQLEMPPLGLLSDGQLAAALTYIRREWDHTASPVDAAEVAAVRTETAGRAAAWTETELTRVP